MQIHVHSKNIDLDDAEKAYIQSKIMKVAHHGGRAEDESAEIRVEVEKQTSRNIHQNIVIEVTMFVPNGVIRAEDSADSVEAAVDQVESKLLKQVARYKTKMHRRDKSGKWLPESTIAEVTDEGQEEFEEPKIMRRKRLEHLTPMHEDEAIESMELLDHDFYLFFNKNTNRESLLYKREDGFYGILEPMEEGGFKKGDE